MACYGNSFTFLYVDDDDTSQETHLWASTACYGDSFTLLCVDGAHISQEASPWAIWACYRDSFTFYLFHSSTNISRNMYVQILLLKLLIF
jgi:hypothetical protein